MSRFVIQNIFRRTKSIQPIAMATTRSISVDVRQGTIIGKTSTLPNGEPYHAFKGIPYAVSPAGDLRFKAPVPLEKFPKDVIDCSEEGDISFHRDPFTNNIVGSEDCLFLNVFTPKLKSDKPLPVMVWIHGGAFLMGSGNSDFYLPVHLIEEDVVVVTLNYRLGIFGFLCLPDAGIPGNAGLKDQLLALKWVRENIKNFNGDPNNITLFGQSAGAASVHIHLLSPNSKKYFDKAICTSGVAINEWVIQNYGVEKSRKLAELMGFKSNSDKDILEYLKNHKEPIHIYKHLLGTLTADEKRRGLPMPFKPVIEQMSDEAIVPKPPLAASMEPNIIDKPVMMGYTSMEGIAMLMNATKKFDEYNKDLARFIPRSVNLEPEDPLCLILAEEMRNFYFNGRPMSNETLNEVTCLMTDYHFNIGIQVAAEIHARKQHKSPLYFFRFSFNGAMNMYKKLFGFGHLDGACHGDEIFYLFGNGLKERKLGPESAEAKIVKQMCRMWTNFAKFGNPTPACDKDLNIKWNPVKPVGSNEEFVLDFLDINTESKMDKNPDQKRINFWRNVYRKYNSSFLKPKL